MKRLFKHLRDRRSFRDAAGPTLSDAKFDSPPQPIDLATGSLDARGDRDGVCEPRLALSASMPVDWILDDVASGDDAAAANEPSPNIQPQSASTPTRGPSDTMNPAGGSMNPAGGWGASSGNSGATAGSGGQTVVVIDTGVAADHAAFGDPDGFGPEGPIVGGYDFAETDAVPYDDGPAGYHGTFVTSQIIGLSDPSTLLDSTGEPIHIVSLRVFDDAGHSDLQWVESALDWVHQNRDQFEYPITTVNLSLGIGIDDADADAVARDRLSDELAQLAEDDILVFAASGNHFDGDLNVAYPASDPNVVAIGSVDHDGSISDFSARGQGMFATHGDGVTGAVPDHVFGRDGVVDDTATLSGTSLAAPRAAATAVHIRGALSDAGLPSDASSVLQWMEQNSIQRTDPITGVTLNQVDLDASLDAIESHLSTITNPTGGPSEFVGDDTDQSVTLDVAAMRIDASGESFALATVDDPEATHRLSGGGGGDQLVIRGSDAAERVTLSAAGASQIVVGNRVISIDGFESIRFEGGGNDRVTLFDSARDDTLTSDANGATLQSVGSTLSVGGVRDIYVHATAGGNDTAILRDGVGDDALVIRPQFVSMRSGGDGGQFRLAFGFENVTAIAAGGTENGYDTVRVYDSEGDDVVSISSRQTVLAGEDYRVAAAGFENTVATSDAGGNDTARIYLDDVDDLRHGRFDPTIDRAAIGSNYGTAVRFERAEVFQNYQAIDLDDWINHNDQATRRVFESMGEDD